MLIKPKGSPFHIFWHYATFSERKKFKNFKFFFKKRLLCFLSLRYSADFRRSRLVFFFLRQTTILTLMGPLFLQQKLLKILRPKAKSGQKKLSAKGPFRFLLFQGNLQNQTCLNGPLLIFFSAL